MTSIWRLFLKEVVTRRHQSKEPGAMLRVSYSFHWISTTIPYEVMPSCTAQIFVIDKTKATERSKSKQPRFWGLKWFYISNKSTMHKQAMWIFKCCSAMTLCCFPTFFHSKNSFGLHPNNPNTSLLEQCRALSFPNCFLRMFSMDSKDNPKKWAKDRRSSHSTRRRRNYKIWWQATRPIPTSPTSALCDLKEIPELFWGSVPLSI